ncbi:MAG TPA: DUF2059 domain-containing protein [Rhizomicrobium sp.]|nr:DUF2059 domain-containing protein [Rhizomicrobium sp.]
MRAAMFGTVLGMAILGAAHADPATPAAPPVTATPAPAAPEAATESHIAAALDLLEASHSMSNLTELVDSMLTFATVQMKHEHPDLDDADIARFKKILSDALVAHQDGYERAVAVVYAEHFSEADLHALADFYRSDVGKRYIAALPSMIEEFAPAGMVWGEQVAREALEKFFKTLPKNKEHA